MLDTFSELSDITPMAFPNSVTQAQIDQEPNSRPFPKIPYSPSMKKHFEPLSGLRREFSIIPKFIQSIYEWTSLFANRLDHSQICSSFINGRSIHKWTKMAARPHKKSLTE